MPCQGVRASNQLLACLLCAKKERASERALNLHRFFLVTNTFCSFSVLGERYQFFPLFFTFFSFFPFVQTSFVSKAGGLAASRPREATTRVCCNLSVSGCIAAAPQLDRDGRHTCFLRHFAASSSILRMYEGFFLFSFFLSFFYSFFLSFFLSLSSLSLSPLSFPPFFFFRSSFFSIVQTRSDRTD